MEMTPKQRFFARLSGEPVDKIPNLNIVMLFAARYAGASYGAFCADYRVLVDAQTKTAKKFGIDILSTMSDPLRETFDYGASVRFAEDNLPECTEPLLKSADDFEKLRRWNPTTSVRMLDRIRAVELFKKQDGEEYPILGWVEGAWAEFTDLAAITEAMMFLYTEPEFVHKCLDLLTEQAIDCAEAQIAAGADVIGIGDAAASLISPELYREFVFEREKKLIEAIHRRGAKTKLHICGNINHILPYMVDTGSDIIDIDYTVNFDQAISLSQGKCSLSGHFNPVEVLLQGTPEEVRRWTNFCVEHGNRYNFISGGCEVPKMTPYENLLAVDEALRG